MDAIIEQRQATITLDLGGERLDLERLDVVERLSELFVIIVDGVSRLAEIDFLEHLGKRATIEITEQDSVRTFNAVLCETVFLEDTRAGYHYRLTLRPWLYMLGNNQNFRIFQDKSALTIIKDILAPYDVDYSKLSTQTAERRYCLQYRESDLNFVSRLMEEEGIYYYFQHSIGKHTLVLCDSRSSHPEASYAQLQFIPPSQGKVPLANTIWQWNERISTTGQSKATISGWNFELPSRPLKEEFETTSSHPGDTLEIYDYPGVTPRYPGSTVHETSPSSIPRTKVTVEGHRALRRAYYGESNAERLAYGQIFKLAQHSRADLNQEYLVIGLTYRIQAEQYRSGSGSRNYEMMVGIEAIPASIPFRAPLRTPKPLARGPETAIVTGPEGEVIYTDEFGRVKVQFHWDREGKKDEKTTCWIRVSHPSAGKAFGHVTLPRIGQEVIVDFLDGDPDRPIITGRVYNADQMQMYALSDNRTRSWWRSETVGQSGQDYDGAEHPPPQGPGSNEIRFEDKEGNEEVYVHAQRDMNTVVQRDQTLKVERDRTDRVGRDRTVAVKRNETLTVEDGDEARTVKTGKRTTSIQQDDALTVQQGNLTTTVSQGNHSTKVSMGNMDTDVAMGNYSLKTDLGSVTIEAMQKIELKVGGNSVVIDQTGVTIKGIMVSAEGQAMLTAKAPMTEVQGEGLLTLKGGITMIN